MYISKAPFIDKRLLESFGVRTELGSTDWWTTPSVGRADGSQIFIRERDFIEVETGFYQNDIDNNIYPISGRFKPSQVLYVEPQGVFTSQRIQLRPLQANEPENGVF
jgi:hypothetical protein